MTSAMQDGLLAAGAALLQAGGLLALAPLLKTVIKKMKARLQNRQGPPLLQGHTTTWRSCCGRSRCDPTWRRGSMWRVHAYFAAAVAATTLVPVVFAAAPLESAGGILLLVGRLRWALRARDGRVGHR